jgi:regulator of sigma E protease
MGGPIMIGELAGRVVVLGIVPMLLLIAFLSANIGFLNLLPIPVLDGGHLLFYGIEALRRKPLNQRMQEIGFQIGIALVLMLMVYVGLNDLLRVWRRLTGDG